MRPMSDHRSCCAILPIAIFASACAARQLPDEPMLKDYALSQLDMPLKSGLRVVVQEDRSSPIVVVTATYGVGSTSDPKGVEGLAHLVEHLAFRARVDGGPQFWDILKRTGAEFNAFTSSDVTSYYQIAHKDLLRELLELEAMRLWKTVEGVTPEVFATEREVVRNELRQRYETTIGNKMFDVVLRQLFPEGHPLSRAVAGTHESLSAATLEHARAFVKQHYRPENCTIVVSGDVDPAEVKRLVGTWPAELLFGPGGPDGPAVPPRKRVAELPIPPVPPPAHTDLVRVKGPIETPTLVVAWSAPAGWRGNTTLLQATGTQLNLAMAIGLGEDMAERDDFDIEGAGAFVLPLADASVFLAFANVRPGADPEAARRRILDTVSNAWTSTDFDDKNVLGKTVLESTRWRAVTSSLLSLSEPTALGLALSEFVSFTGKTQFFKESFDEIKNVKVSQVTEFAYRWLQRDRSVAVYFEPENDTIPRQFGGGGGRGSGAARATHDVGRDTAASVAGMGPEQILKVARSPELAGLPRFKLPSGLEIVVARHGSAPVAQIRLGLAGGEASARPYGLANLAVGFSRTRCRDHGSLTPIGGSLGQWVATVSGTVAVDVISGNLVNGIAVLSDHARCQDVDEESFVLDLGRALKREKKIYDRIAKQPDFIASKALYAALYPDHPYGVVAVDPDELKDVKLADAQAFVRAHYQPETALAVIAGDVDLDETRALAQKYLTMWRGGGIRAATPLPPSPPRPGARRVLFVDRQGATQVTARVACRLQDAAPETLPAFDVLSELASERAWQLREQWGATYGVAARAIVQPGGAAHLMFSGAIENQQAGPAIARLIDLVSELASERLSQTAFLQERWDVARGFSARFATGGQIAEAVLGLAARGYPADTYDRYPARLAALTVQDVSRLLDGCVGNEVVALVGDAAVLRPQLAAAGVAIE